MSTERILNTLVSFATANSFGVEENSEFRQAMKEIEKEQRNLATRIYDSGTLVIIDDQNKRLLTKYNLVRKR